jgi:hypothetical protein
MRTIDLIKDQTVAGPMVFNVAPGLTDGKGL